MAPCNIYPSSDWVLSFYHHFGLGFVLTTFSRRTYAGQKYGKLNENQKNGFIRQSNTNISPCCGKNNIPNRHPLNELEVLAQQSYNNSSCLQKCALPLDGNPQNTCAIKQMKHFWKDFSFRAILFWRVQFSLASVNLDDAHSPLSVNVRRTSQNCAS